MSPPSPLSRPGSSNYMLPSQFSESQESVPVVPTPPSRVETQRRRKRAASSVGAPDVKRPKVSLGDAVGALSIAMANARNAVAAERGPPNTNGDRPALDHAKQDIARIVKAPKASAEQRVPEDHREREKRNTFGSKTETNLCNEDCIRPGDKTLFFHRYTKSINQREGASASEEKFRKSRTTTANTHWTNLRRWLGVMGPRELPFVTFLRKTIYGSCALTWKQWTTCEGGNIPRTQSGMHSRMWRVVGAIFLEPVTVDAWKAQVSHRTHDAAKSRDDKR